MINQHKPTCVKNVYKDLKEPRKPIINRAPEDRALRDIWNLFEQEEEGRLLQTRSITFIITIISNMKKMVIEIKRSHLKDILIKLNLT